MLVNLSNRPFINIRPVRRVTVVCWVLGAVLAALNVYLYTQNLAGQSEQRQAQADIEMQLAASHQELARIESDLDGMDLERQNDQIRRLNSIIAERTFSWSELFDRLAEVLPRQVQLDLVSPRIVTETRGSRSNRRRDLVEGDYVTLDLSGTTEDGAAVLELLDALYGHPRFLDPDLRVEAKREDEGTEDFSLNVLYLPTQVGTEIDEAMAASEALNEDEGSGTSPADSGEAGSEEPPAGVSE